MLYKVFGRSSRTPWVELNAFENEADARALAKEILARGGEEVMIETHTQLGDEVHNDASPI